MSTKPAVLSVVGPTATGKTALSVSLAKRLHGEIVSADAVAVYRGMDVGSAKPTPEERQGVPHHMIDCAEITDTDFTVSAFREQARAAIDGVLARNRLPIVVGGSGLYADAIFSDMRFSAPSDPALRAALETDYDRDKNAFFALLSASDPVTAARLHPNDKKRVVRAMEVYRLTGKPFSELNRSFRSAQAGDGTYRIVRVGLTADRGVLYSRIDRRVDRMAENGLIDEAYGLFARGLTPDRYTAMQAIGYAQLYEAYCGRCSEAEAIDAIKLATRHFAKRQITWFKRDPNTVWFDILRQDPEEIITQITELLYGNP
jgi:tRNA dimethylallyltransferase